MPQVFAAGCIPLWGGNNGRIVAQTLRPRHLAAKNSGRAESVVAQASRLVFKKDIN